MFIKNKNLKNTTTIFLSTLKSIANNDTSNTTNIYNI